MTQPLRVVVVDDEPPARRRIRRMLRGLAAVEIVGEAGTGQRAVDVVEEVRPDVLLLDIQMPDFDGFEVIRRLTTPRASIIFVTAYDQFAVRAFELHALDYLLKPFSAERCAEAIERARRQRSTGGHTGLDPLMETLARDRPYLERVPVKQGHRLHLVPMSAVVRIEAADNYVSLFTRDGEYLWRETLNRVEARLDPECFVRVHRSAIVRLEAIDRLEARSRGDYDVYLRDGSRVAVGRTYRAGVQRAISRAAR